MPADTLTVDLPHTSRFARLSHSSAKFSVANGPTQVAPKGRLGPTQLMGVQAQLAQLVRVQAWIASSTVSQCITTFINIYGLSYLPLQFEHISQIRPDRPPPGICFLLQFPQVISGCLSQPSTRSTVVLDVLSSRFRFPVMISPA